MTRLYAGSAAALVCGLLAGTAYWALTGGRSDDRFAACRNTVVSGEATIGGPFTLTDQTNTLVTEAQVLAKPALVYFGYTFCPDICPVDNARNAEAVDILEEQGFEVTPVFITIDPLRDTPEVLAEYAAAMHPRMIGLTGTAEQVKAAAAAYRVYYQAQPEVDGAYLMDHSTFTYLMIPGTGFVEFFRREASGDQVATQAACFLQAA